MAWGCRERTGKAKELQLNLARDVENNKKSLGTWDNKGRQKKLQPPTSLVSEMGDLVTTGMEKAEVLNIFFSLVFTGKCSSCATQLTASEGRGWENKVPPITELCW